MTEVNTEKLNELTGHVMNQTAGAVGVLLAYMGHELGLYRAMADGGPMLSDELAAATSTSPRYVLEWLNANVAGGYLAHDPLTGKFHITPEQEVLFANDGQAGCMRGFFQVVVAAYLGEERNRDAFRTDEGIPWTSQHPCVFEGTRRLYGPLYEASLLSERLPALDGVQAKLEGGARVADIGCGHGAATIIMAKAFPRSEFHGYDFHESSIEIAAQHAEKAGAANVKFEVANSKSLPTGEYDFLTMFDSLHDMGDPIGIASHLRTALKGDGTLMLVEPLAGDTVEENAHPLGQTFYGLSALFCTAISKSQEVGLALGAQAGPKRLSAVLTEGGFSSAEKVLTSGANMIIEAKP